ncbi:MAG TPA: NTP pyrophosphohydrolase [Deltaproteobacteria bacterium]|mgnify:CR=1 FL=1|nr:NTP pyrophosphohydrolase [Deltaproteobacteria bacterium]
MSETISADGTNVENSVGTVGELRTRLRAFNAARDWGQYHSPRNLAMALSVEAGELLELYLWSADDGPQPPVAERLPKVADEAADVFICLLNFCDAAGVDLTSATLDKLRRNAEKYPVDRARGRLEKSTEL